MINLEIGYARAKEELEWFLFDYSCASCSGIWHIPNNKNERKKNKNELRQILDSIYID